MDYSKEYHSEMMDYSKEYHSEMVTVLRLTNFA